MLKTFGVLQGIPQGWKIGYGGHPDGKTYWGLTFPTLSRAMEFIKKQSPGKLIVVIKADDHLNNKCGTCSEKHQSTRLKLTSFQYPFFRHGRLRSGQRGERGARIACCIHNFSGEDKS
jgi:hypothetical protein